MMDELIDTADEFAEGRTDTCVLARDSYTRERQIVAAVVHDIITTRPDINEPRRGGRRHQRGDSWPLRVSRAHADYFDHILKSVTAVECSVEEELEDDHWTSFGARCVPLQTTDLEMDSVSGWSRYKGDKHCEQEEEFSGDAATRQHITRLAEGALKAEVARLVRAEMDVLPHATEVVGAQWIENYVFRSLQHLLPVLFQQLCALREQRQDFKPNGTTPKTAHENMGMLVFEAARCLSMDEGVVAVAEERFRTISHHYNPECDGNK